MRYWGLYLNPMRGRCEEKHCIAVSDNREALEALLNDNRVDRYNHKEGDGTHPTDHVWNKCYRQGSRLEWYNPPEDCGQGYGILDLGTREEYMQRHAENWDSFINEYRM